MATYYKYDADGWYAGSVEADAQPANSTSTAPDLTSAAGHKWGGSAWTDYAQDADIAAHARSWTPYEFYSKFTAAEKAALIVSTDASVIEFRNDMSLYQVIYPDSDECKTAMAYLATLGILTEARKTEILK